MGDGLSIEQLNVASAVFHAYVDTTLGGSLKALDSLLLFAKREHGEPLSEPDLKSAQAWKDAERVGRELASRAVGSPENVNFLAQFA